MVGKMLVQKEDAKTAEMETLFLIPAVCADFLLRGLCFLVAQLGKQVWGKQIPTQACRASPVRLCERSETIQQKGRFNV